MRSRSLLELSNSSWSTFHLFLLYSLLRSYSLGSSALLICNCMKKAFLSSHFGQFASVESTFFQLSSPPMTSSICFLFNFNLVDICFWIGNWYGHVGQAHWLQFDSSVPKSRRLEHVGQNSILICSLEDKVKKKESSAVCFHRPSPIVNCLSIRSSFRLRCLVLSQTGRIECASASNLHSMAFKSLLSIPLSRSRSTGPLSFSHLA